MTHLIATNPFFSAYAQADFFGKLIFFSLYALSALCWIILIAKFLETQKIKKVAAHLKQLCAKNQTQILDLEIQEKHPFAEIYRSLKNKTVEVLSKNHFFSDNKTQTHLSERDLELVESYVLTTISIESKALEKNLFILSITMTLAPFLGLLGTVWGILITFAELHSGASASSSTAILGGLSTALATTVLGLVIAIPALIAHNFLKTVTRNLASDMEDFLYHTLSTIDLQYRKVDT
ncbi:MAG: MotA/TolQ/ExbB proton channel family protein [Chlamydiota bacterium]